MVREALADHGRVVEVFALPEAAQRHPEIRAAADDAGVTWHLAEERAVSALAETVHSQGLVAVCRFLDRPVDDMLSAGTRLIAVCVDIRDPGNAGTVIRTADAAGADGVVLAGSSVDPYNGKAVRSSAGSLFHLPPALEPDAAGVLARLRGHGLQILAADGTGELLLDDAADSGVLARPTAWLFGNEARGLPPALAQLADDRVAIPIHGRAESLNLATAAAICLYASARAQRRPV